MQRKAGSDAGARKSAKASSIPFVRTFETEESKDLQTQLVRLKCILDHDVMLRLASLPLEMNACTKVLGAVSTQLEVSRMVCSQTTLPLQASGQYTDGDGVFSDILMPCSPDEFFEHTWEKMPLFISRPSLRQWYSDWLSEESIFALLADEDSDVQYGINLDVTAYNGEVRLSSTYECPLCLSHEHFHLNQCGCTC